MCNIEIHAVHLYIDSCMYLLLYLEENCLAYFASAARHKEWFDALIDLQAVLNVDLQQEMGRQRTG